MKRITSFLLMMALIVGLFGLEVDRKEIESGGAASVIEFVNYNGPHSVINTAAEIRGIGTSLVSSFSGGNTAGDPSRYHVIHAVDSAVTTGLDADILILGPGATVDHIDNVRRILASYLSAAYGYSEKDSGVLAVYITVYNAVYRGKMDVFSGRYKPVVTKHLVTEKVGLSLRYDEWPGRSQIVIPLSDPRLAGTISTVDTSALTSKDVTEKIKEDGESGISTRKDMVDIKEREGTEAQGRAETAQTEATKAKAEAAKKQQEAVAAEAKAKDARAESEKANTEAAAKPDDPVAQKKAAEATVKADKATAESAEKQKEAAKAEETVTSKETAATADQKLADTKEKEATEERREIASDAQKDLDKKEADAKDASRAALATSIPRAALRVIDDSTMLSELVLINLADGKIIKTSSLNSVRNRTLIDTGGSLMAVAGKKSGSGAVRLVLIDPSTLEVTAQGKDSIAEKSMLAQGGNDYYAVLELEGGTCVLGRFDSSLALKARSAIQVIPHTAIAVTPNGILVQNDKGMIRLLRSTDLVDQTVD